MGYSMTNNTTLNQWELNFIPTNLGVNEITLNTAGTFLDRNISVTTTLTNNLSANINGTNIITSTISAKNTDLGTDDKSIIFSSNNNSGVGIDNDNTAVATISAIAAQSGFAAENSSLGTGTIEGSNSITKYIKEVKITPPSTGEREFGVTVPNGTNYITFVFHIDSSGNVKINNEYTLTY